jgi:dihydrofolate reductase
VVGRKLFDLTRGWGGWHPMGLPVVVITSRPANTPADAAEGMFHFAGNLSDGIALARELAGDKDVGVNGGSIASQCLNAGLLDEVGIDLVPVFLGGGKRLSKPLVDPYHSKAQSRPSRRRTSPTFTSGYSKPKVRVLGRTAPARPAPAERARRTSTPGDATRSVAARARSTCTAELVCEPRRTRTDRFGRKGRSSTLTSGR